MKLKSIKINGFKSFADKTEIELKDNITAIVGPNGSGKSNIVDAVRWVLGEQSIKSLRGSNNMCDVIFSGSKTRNALKRCEVSLTFDNDEHYLNTELTDIEIKRILYYTGENEYYINNSKVRLKDITNLFLDSGIGSFNIISQGNIEEIVNSKAESRRTILESAAGVLKYKTRKTESLKKLEKTKDNLEKVSLVTDELALTVKPLKEQSEIAKKYLAYKQELEDLEISLTTYDITNMHEMYNILLKEIKELEEAKSNLELTSNKDTSKTEKLKLDLINIEEKITSLKDRLMELNQKINVIESEKTLLLERQKYEVHDDLIDEDLLKLKESELAIQKELAIVLNDYQEKEEKLKELSNTLRDEEEKQSLLKIQRKHLANELENTRKNNFVLKNKISLLEGNLEDNATLPSSVKNVINNPRLKGIHGTIGASIEVQEKYATAIDIALSSSANFIIVDNEDSAKLAIEYLKNNHLGRATFFPINVIKPRYINNEDLEKIESIKGVIGIASDLVATDSLYESIIKNQLGNVIVVSNINVMNEVAKTLNYRYRVVTLEGEITHAGGSISGGVLLKQNSTLKTKQEIRSLKEELENNEYSLTSLEKKNTDYQDDEEKLTEQIIKIEHEVYGLKEVLGNKKNSLDNLQNKLDETKKSIEGANTLKSGSIEESLIKLMENMKEVEVERDLTIKNINDFQNEKSEITSLVSSLEQEYKLSNQEFKKIENDLKNHEIEVGKLDTKMDYLLNILTEEYHLTYEKAKMDYVLEIEPDIARMKVNRLKKDISSLGSVNIGSISEYERVSERYNFLMSQKNDLESSCDELYKIIGEMDEIMKEKLTVSFAKISQEFSEVFKKLFKGGEGKLVLTDEENILETGIDIIAEPPGKKLNNIQALSGGEKTLTAIALLFAILNVYPVPFCILDEVEAALDEANVDTFGEYLQNEEEKSEFILITHKKRTMEYAKTLYGITMQEQGVSKIVSVKLKSEN